MKKLLCLAVVSMALAAPGMPAARPVMAAPASPTFTVTSTLDVADTTPSDGNCDTPAISLAAGACTLRAAVMSADAASGVGATIIVPPGIYTLTIPADVNDYANVGDLNLTKPASGDPLISIVGAGAGRTIIDGNGQDGVLSVEKGRTAAISGVTLRNGFRGSGGVGGGLANDGNLSLDSSTVSGNQTTGSFPQGGGIYNSNSLTVTNSTIGPNNASYYGGGIFNSGRLTVDRSTIYGDSAYSGAGIDNDNSSYLYLINSTVSQNTATNDGGALLNYGIANAYNATLVYNGAETEPTSSTKAGGVSSDNSGTVNLRNTLLAGNYHDNSFEPADCTGNITSYGFNLFGENPPCSVFTGTGSWDVINSLALIGPLQNNGGPTLTHALLAGSNAIDSGDPSSGCIGPDSLPLATDQRGLPRVVGARCDIGAFEYLPPAVYLPLLRN